MNYTKDITAKITQEKLSPEKVSAIKNSTHVSERASYILASLDLVMCFAKKTGGDPFQSIQDYTNLWHLDGANLQIGLPNLQLKHLVALYEEVEDFLGKILAECVNPVYCIKLPDDIKDQIAVCANKVPLETLIITFRRFILRYLCVDQIAPENFIVDYLCNPSMCWPTGAFKSEEEIKAVFPKHLCIAHTYSAYAFWSDKQEEQEKKKQASTAAKMATVTQQKVAAKKRSKTFSSQL